MGILQAVVMATTVVLVMFAWRLTFEVEALDELTGSPAEPFSAG